MSERFFALLVRFYPVGFRQLYGEKLYVSSWIVPATRKEFCYD